MKKLIIYAIVAAMCLTLGSCSKRDIDKSATTENGVVTVAETVIETEADTESIPHILRDNDFEGDFSAYSKDDKGIYSSAYDEYGNEIGRTYYDLHGTPLYTAEYSDGKALKDTYTDDGKVTKTIEYEYTSAGKIKKEITTKYSDDDISVQSREYEYDSENRPIKVTDYSDGKTVSSWFEVKYEKITSGLTSTITYYRADGSVSGINVQEFDSQNNILYEKYSNVPADKLTGNDKTPGEGYDDIEDAFEDLIGYSEYERKYEYDEDGRLVKKIIECGSGGVEGYYYRVGVSSMSERATLVPLTIPEYSDLELDFIEYKYDDKGNLTEKKCYLTDGRFNIFKYKYENGHKVQEDFYDHNGDLERSIYYDTDGNIIKQTIAERNGIIEWYEFVYDSRGIIRKELLYREGEGLRFGFEYDGCGRNVIGCELLRSGGVNWYLYEYDDKGNEVKITNTDSVGNILSWTEYEYDEMGNRTKITYYDSEGNIIENNRNKTKQ